MQGVVDNTMILVERAQRIARTTWLTILFAVPLLAFL
jgi:hypothetical protein